jgi:uncharacterized small protein (DUF1192 family)
MPNFNNTRRTTIYIRLDNPIREKLETMVNLNQIETDEFVSLMIEEAYTLYLKQLELIKINELKERKMMLQREIKEIDQQLNEH